MAAVLATSALAAATAASSAEPTLAAEWSRFCLGPRADATKAIALADAAGWRPAAAPSSGPFNAGVARKRTASDGERLLAISTLSGSVPDHPELQVVQCTLVASGTESPIAALTALLGAPPATQEQGLAKWLLVESNGAYKAVATADEIRNAGAGPARQAIVQAGAVPGGHVLIVFMAPRPNKPH